MSYKIDATNQVLGRLAGNLALMLRGKDTPHFDPARYSMRRVIVYNTDGLRVTGRKMLHKVYRRHSGYPGGLKEESLSRLMSRDSRLALRRAVGGMLPKNRLRPRMLKNLILYKKGVDDLQRTARRV